MQSHGFPRLATIQGLSAANLLLAVSGSSSCGSSCDDHCCGCTAHRLAICRAARRHCCCWQTSPPSDGLWCHGRLRSSPAARLKLQLLQVKLPLQPLPAGAVGDWSVSPGLDAGLVAVGAGAPAVAAGARRHCCQLPVTAAATAALSSRAMRHIRAAIRH